MRWQTHLCAAQLPARSHNPYPSLGSSDYPLRPWRVLDLEAVRAELNSAALSATSGRQSCTIALRARRLQSHRPTACCCGPTFRSECTRHMGQVWFICFVCVCVCIGCEWNLNALLWMLFINNTQLFAPQDRLPQCAHQRRTSDEKLQFARVVLA